MIIIVIVEFYINRTELIIIFMTLFLEVDHAYYANGRPKEKVHYHLPTFDKELNTRCFSLSYYLSKVESGLEPDPSVPCDLPVCHASSVQDIQVLACLHSFRVTCLPADGCCTISSSSPSSPKHPAQAHRQLQKNHITVLKHSLY